MKLLLLATLCLCLAIGCGSNSGGGADTATQLAKYALDTKADTSARMDALKRLKALSPYESEIVSDLTDLTKDHNPGIRHEACIILGRTKTSAAESALKALLRDGDASARASAAHGLAQTESKSAFASLVETLSNDDDEGVKLAVVQVLGSFRHQSRELIRLLRDALTNSNVDGDLSGVEEAALSALVSIGSVSTPTLVDIVKNPKIKTAIRLGAIHRVDQIAFYARTNWNKDLYGLKDDVLELVVEGLSSVLGDQKEEVREGAARALGNLADKAKSASASLKEYALRSTANERVSGALALYKTDPHDPLSVRLLIAELSEGHGRIRAAAAHALDECGRDGKANAAVPALRSALQDRDRAVRLAAANALSAIASVDAVPDLVKGLDDEESVVRSAMARALASMGARATAAVPALQRALNDQNQIVREDAKRALGMIKGD
jgi:HEAT repeat protein